MKNKVYTKLWRQLSDFSAIKEYDPVVAHNYYEMLRFYINTDIRIKMVKNDGHATNFCVF